MEFNAVYHQASDNYCYPLNEDELIINIKTGYDVKSVSIIPVSYTHLTLPTN